MFFKVTVFFFPTFFFSSTTTSFLLSFLPSFFLFFLQMDLESVSTHEQHHGGVEREEGSPVVEDLMNGIGHPKDNGVGVSHEEQVLNSYKVRMPIHPVKDLGPGMDDEPEEEEEEEEEKEEEEGDNRREDSSDDDPTYLLRTTPVRLGQQKKDPHHHLQHHPIQQLQPPRSQAPLSAAGKGHPKTSQSSSQQTQAQPWAKRTCNCKNSKCLKLYCECFAAGEYCRGSAPSLSCRPFPNWRLNLTSFFSSFFVPVTATARAVRTARTTMTPE